MSARRRAAAGVVACASLGLAARGAAQSPTAPAAGGFVMLVGSDTLSVERVTRAGDSVVSDLRIVRSGIRLRQTLGAGERGLLARYDLAVFPPGARGDASPAQQLRFRFTGDTVHVEGGAPPVLAIASGTLPWLNPSMALFEQLVRRARALGGDSVTVPMLNITGAQRFTARVQRLSADSVLVTFPDVQTRLAVASDGSVVGGSVAAQNLRIVRVASLDAQASTGAPPDYSAPPGAPYEAREVTVPTPGGFTLAGTFTRPRGAARVPAVVLITGSGLEDRDEALPIVRGYRPFRDIADTLGRRGIAVLRLDDRGYGGSGGNGATATSADFADDVRAALAWLRAQPGVDRQRLALVGHSEGGLIAPLVAAQDTTLAGIVLMAGPAWTGRRVIADQNAKLLARRTDLSSSVRDSLLGVAMRAVDSSAVGTPWLRYFLDYDPLPTARRVRAPVLVLQGATDQQVDPTQADALGAALRGGRARGVTVRVFPETNHLFLRDPSGDPLRYASLGDVHVRREVLGVLADWLATTLRVR